MVSKGDSNLLKSGDYVIIRKIHDDKNWKLVEIGDKKSVYFGIRYNVASLIGSTYSDIFELDRRTKSLIKLDLNENELRDVYASLADGNDSVSKDNRNILDDGKSQKLTRDEIESLKEEGLTGKEIVDTLIKNSASFENKTVYSQMKYLKKKHQKYLNLVKLYKPNIALLTEMYYSQGPSKISHLRIDTISLMLNLCNVRSGSKYMVVDCCMGLVTAAILERLVGDGSVVTRGYQAGACIQVLPEPGPVSTWRQSVDALNLPPEALESTLFSLPIRKLVHSVVEKMEEDNKEDNPSDLKEDRVNDDNKGITEEQEEEEEEVVVSKSVETEDVNVDRTEYSDDADGLPHPKRVKYEQRQERKASRRREEEKAKELLSARDMDGLLIVVRQFDPVELLDILIDYLAPSRPFGVFCSFLEPLTECYKTLKEKAIGAKICETWLRSYQVLDNRTHPHIHMSSSGGYLLTAIKVDTN